MKNTLGYKSVLAGAATSLFLGCASAKPHLQDDDRGPQENAAGVKAVLSEISGRIDVVYQGCRDLLNARDTDIKYSNDHRVVVGNERLQQGCSWHENPGIGEEVTFYHNADLTKGSPMNLRVGFSQTTPRFGFSVGKGKTVDSVEEHILAGNGEESIVDETTTRLEVAFMMKSGSPNSCNAIRQGSEHRYIRGTDIITSGKRLPREGYHTSQALAGCSDVPNKAKNTLDAIRTALRAHKTNPRGL